MSVKAAVDGLRTWVFTSMVLVQPSVFGVLNFQRPKMNEKFRDAVVQLHDIARLVEQEIGSGLLSEDIRNAADRLHALTKIEVEANNNA
jgi:hypothetical protein